MIPLSEVWDRLWLFGFFGLFVALELTAVAFKRKTLSSAHRDWFSLRERKRAWLLRRIVFGAFWALLIVAHGYFSAPAWWSVIIPLVPYVGVIVYAVFFEKEAA